MNEELHLRNFVAPELCIREDDEGRILEGLCVPFDTSQTIEHEGLTEVFRRGAFRQQCKAPNRLGLYDEHFQDPDHRLGIGRELEERPEGLWASFRLLRTRAALVADLLAEGHQGLSIAFRDAYPRTLANGVIERRRVHLEHVALVAKGAFPGAGVLALRAEQAPEDHPDTTFWADIDHWALTRKRIWPQTLEEPGAIS